MHCTIILLFVFAPYQASRVIELESRVTVDADETIAVLDASKKSSA